MAQTCRALTFGATRLQLTCGWLCANYYNSFCICASVSQCVCAATTVSSTFLLSCQFLFFLFLFGRTVTGLSRCHQRALSRYRSLSDKRNHWHFSQTSLLRLGIGCMPRNVGIKRAVEAKKCFLLPSLCAASQMWVRHWSVVIIPPEGDLEFWWDSKCVGVLFKS